MNAEFKEITLNYAGGTADGFNLENENFQSISNSHLWIIRLASCLYFNSGSSNDYQNMQKDKIEILKVVLKVGNRDIELSLEQARELKEVLVNLFPDNRDFNPPLPVSLPYYPPIQPILIDPIGPPPPPPWKQWETWCENQGTYSINCKS